MKKIINIIFSMQTMGVLLLLFAAVIGAATFIENDFGTAAAKAVVYNTNWFDLLLLLLAINLTGNIFIYKLYMPKKFTIFLYHFAFLVILLGAAITRFVSFEGMMHIRQGSSSNTMLSDKSYIDVRIKNGADSAYLSKATNLSLFTQHNYKAHLKFEGRKYSFKSVKFVPNAREVIRNSEKDGKPYLIFVASYGTGRQEHYFEYNIPGKLGTYKVNFGDKLMDDAINIKMEQDSTFKIFTSDTVFNVYMTADIKDTLLPGQWNPFQINKLYTYQQLSFVVTHFYHNGVVYYQTYRGKDVRFSDLVVVEATSGDETKKIILRGSEGVEGVWQSTSFGQTTVSMRYGAKNIRLPFAIQLHDFQIEYYPGSQSPSSFASEVQLIDNDKGVDVPYRIYMNHVLNYRGYRFFQSSYDPDKQGTILSVNHDYWGTFFTYIGYFLMALGMFLTLFNKNSRFVRLGKSIAKPAKPKVAGILILLLLSTAAMAQQKTIKPQDVPAVNKEQAEKFGRLLVQSHDGRIKPVNTLASELLRKIARKTKFLGQNPDQILLGMMSDPYTWQTVPMIKVGHPELKKLLGIQGKYASYLDFIKTNTRNYKLRDAVSAAYGKKPSEQSKFDQEVIKADERMNICFMVYRGDFLNILPNPTDPYKKWFNAHADFTGIPAGDSSMMVQIIPNYLQAVREGDTTLAKQLVEGIASFQKHYGAEVIPSESKVNLEITYNKLNIFNNLSLYYLFIGLLLIILSFIEVFRDSRTLKIVIKAFIVLIILGFIYQTAGLAMRWYISGHAPWSDGYESMIYIAWVTLLAGLVFSKQSNMTIAATTFLTSIILMVAHLSWMDPEITPLVPVLKSYWLTIHVSVITASYGFLALSALLGFMNLILIILQSKKNFAAIQLRITNLTAINERSLMIGLYLLTIGTFLGGVWANESWGRYWGWDPKETWALVSVLVYALIAHMNNIPGLRGKFAFNFASVIGYSSILMTFFGVNYYLSGLHSYASGDPVPIPSFVYYMVGAIIVVSLWAYLNFNRHKKLETDNSENA